MNNKIENKSNQSSQSIFAKRYGIGEQVCRALEALGYKEPMPVQDEMIHHVQKGNDLIVQSKTGSGKTAAFGIPIIDVLDVKENAPQVLVITPTRELAVQVSEALGDIGKYKKIRCLPIYGKQPIELQVRHLKQRVHIVVGTPGRLIDLMNKGYLQLDVVKYLVIDEADELLKKGFLPDVKKIIQQLPRTRTTLLLSATMPEEIEAVCKAYMTAPQRIEVENEETSIEEIKQSYIEVAADWKPLRLREILQKINPSQALIFCNTRDQVDLLTKQMKEQGYDSIGLHGQMLQKHRLKAIDAFKSAKVQYLIATDLVGRGIHIDQLPLVVNYQVPKDPENYVHRIGRTGRAGEKGEAISFVNVHEIRDLKEIEDYIGYKVPKVEVETIKSKASDQVQSREEKRSKIKAMNERKHKDITRLRINGGKKKKIRLGDIVGAVSNLPGIDAEDIGIIEIEQTCSYIEIHNGKGQLAFDGLSKATVKGKAITVKMLKSH